MRHRHLAMFWALIASLFAVAPAPATAGPKMLAIAEDNAILLAHPNPSLAQFRVLGVNMVRVTVHWADFAPHWRARKRPHGFTLKREANPREYAPGVFKQLDNLVVAGQRDGISVELNISGPGPIWAEGPNHPSGKHNQWDPSPKDFGAFVMAVGKRYDGHFVPRGAPNPLPRVSAWSVWSEPNLGYALAPQGVPGNLKVENSGRMYRHLLSAAWSGLHQSGHGGDLILFGEVAPRGIHGFGVYNAMKPLTFLRALYCVDSHLHQLRGKAASERGCPTDAAGWRHFRKNNPALFEASGFADHMWDRWYPPNKELQPDPDYTSLAEIGHLIHTLDRVVRLYGGHKRFKIYNTEFGYITNPPNNSPLHQDHFPVAHYPSPATAAYYLNWAEYISWRNPRITSFDQYLLSDPKGPKRAYTGWSSGLRRYTGEPKFTYNAWRLPLYLPVTNFKHGHRLELWGCIRPSHFGIVDTGKSQTANIQFKPASGGPYTRLATVTLGDQANCYFDRHITFTEPGTVRLSYTYPAPDPLLPRGSVVVSRTVKITRR